jgi:hypothetical protein
LIQAHKICVRNEDAIILTRLQDDDDDDDDDEPTIKPGCQLDHLDS